MIMLCKIIHICVIYIFVCIKYYFDRFCPAASHWCSLTRTCPAFQHLHNSMCQIYTYRTMPFMTLTQLWCILLHKTDIMLKEICCILHNLIFPAGISRRKLHHWPTRGCPWPCYDVSECLGWFWPCWQDWDENQTTVSRH